MDLAESLRATDAQASILLSPLLIGLCLQRKGGRYGSTGRDGWLPLSLGLAFELVGVASDSWSIARFGLPLAVIGLARLTGRPSLLVAMLAFGAMPVPTSLIALTTPWAESVFAAFGAQAGSVLGSSVTAAGPLLRGSGRVLEISMNQGGLPLAATLVQLGWYSVARRGGTLREALLAALLGALLALPLQALGVLAAVFALDLGWPALGRLWLDWGLGACCALAVIGRVESSARQRCGQRQPD